MERISKVIADSPKVDVAQIHMQTQLPKKKLRELLKRGEGTFWRFEVGPSNKHLYVSVKQE